MVQVVGERLSHSLEFILNNHEDVVCIVALVHRSVSVKGLSEGIYLLGKSTYSVGGGAGGGDVEGVRAGTALSVHYMHGKIRSYMFLFSLPALVRTSSRLMGSDVVWLSQQDRHPTRRVAHVVLAALEFASALYRRQNLRL